MRECYRESDASNKSGESKSVSVAEAGKKGGLTVSAKRGTSWFAQIGSKGQRVLRARHPGMAREWGKKGGRPRKQDLADMREADK